MVPQQNQQDKYAPSCQSETVSNTTAVLALLARLSLVESWVDCYLPLPQFTARRGTLIVVLNPKDALDATAICIPDFPTERV